MNGAVAAAAAADGDTTISERLAHLQRVPIFQELAVNELVPLAAASDIAVFQPGETLVRQGEPGESVYVILQGRVEVRASAVAPVPPHLPLPPHLPAAPHTPHTPHTPPLTPTPVSAPPPPAPPAMTAETVVSWLVAGDTVGELSLFDARPRSATCVAMTETTCLRLDRATFLGAARRNWGMTVRLFSGLADRLRRADIRLAEHARDPLTGVHNRRSLLELYEREASRAQRAARQAGAASEHALNPLALLFADVNRFKDINDSYGHHVGDQVLIALAHVLVAAGRATDFVARFGGDEFIMVLPDAGAEGAEAVARRIRESLVREPPGPVPFTISVGWTLVDQLQPQTLEEALAAADAAMYRDKARRR